MSPILLWLIAGGVFIGIEILLITGAGFLLIGIGALLVGSLLQFGIIAVENLPLQILIFLPALCVSIFMLFKYFKKQCATGQNDLMGAEATVAAPGLVGNKEGAIIYCGKPRRAKLMPNDGFDAVAEESAVIIKSVEDDLVFVVRK